MSDARTPAPPVPLTFVLPGFSKCGTTTLSELLALHPDVLLPRKREPWYFIAPDYPKRWPEYRSLFPEVKRYRAVGDDSTAYTSYRVIDDVVDRLASLYPGLRLLFLARDPVARIESSFREFHHSGPLFGLDAPFTLAEAMEKFPQLTRDSSYATLIDVYRTRFPAEHIKVVFFEDLVNQPQETLDACFDFLGVSTGQVAITEVPRLNQGEDKLHDTRLMRSMRHSRLIGKPVAKLGVQRQDRYFSKLGLRRRFRKPVEWTQPAVKRLQAEVYPDACRFLARYGTPATGWTRLESVARGGARGGAAVDVDRSA